MIRWPSFISAAFLTSAAASASPAAERGGHSSCEVPALASPVTSHPTERAVVSVTVDEIAPPARRMLDAFDRFRMKGTFFVTGEQARAHPGKARAIVASGHELGNHSFRHERVTRHADSGLADLRRTNRVLRRVTGFRPCTFRPPGFTQDDSVVDVARRLRMNTVLATRGNDTFTRDPNAVVDYALDGIAPGDILLLHQVDHSAEALPEILGGLRDRGLRSVPVARLLGGRLERSR